MSNHIDFVMYGSSFLFPMEMKIIKVLVIVVNGQYFHRTLPRLCKEKTSIDFPFYIILKFK
jgi:hypothetical protein